MKIRDNKLDITIINRSNDLYFGVPYNVFVFYLLQKFIANKIGIKPGVQRHFTDSLHLYEKNLGDVEDILNSNCINNLTLVTEKLQKFNIDEYININHQSILNLNFDDVSNTEINNFFKSFQVYKGSNDLSLAIGLLPENILGFIAYQWYRKKKAFSQEFEVDRYEKIIKAL